MGNERDKKLGAPLFEAVREVAAKWPAKAAVEGTSGWICNYKSLIDLAELQAANLANKGVRSSDCIAIYCSNSLSYASLILAVCRLGACYVPIMANFDLEASRRAFDASGAKFVVVDGTRAPPSFGFPVWDITELEGACANPCIPLPDGEGTFRKLWSSGSTGVPKLIGWTQEKLLTERRRWNDHIGVLSSDRFFCRHPLDVAHATDLHLFSAWLEGATCIIYDGDGETEFDWSHIGTAQATIMSALPEHYRQWLRQDEGRACARSNSIRLAMCGGTYLSPTTIADVEEGLGLRLRSIYGSTEFGLAMISEESGTDLRLVKGVAARLEAIAEGNPTSFGHLVLLSDCTSEGYLNQKLAHQETFKADGFWTGDLAQANPDGSFTIIGRAKEAVRHGDRWLTASMIEQLIQRYIGPNNCAAVMDPNSKPTPAATVFIEFASAPPKSRFLETMVSGANRDLGISLEIVLVETLPCTEVGKPDKQILRRHLEEARQWI